MSKIDLGYLIDITDGDKEIMIEMIDLLLEETPKHLKNIKTFYENKQWTKLGAEAHKLKPMLLYVGLTELNEATQELETNGKKAQNLETIPVLIEQLEEGFISVIEELEEKKTQLN
ncbi:MAG: Hpt domain-containing protein [Balneolaceae bacterium]